MGGSICIEKQQELSGLAWMAWELALGRSFEFLDA